MTRGRPFTAMADLLDAIRARITRDLPPGATVLDLSAGTGQVSFAAAERARRLVAAEEYSVIAREARQESLRRKIGLDHVLASPESLPIRTSTVESVLCVNALHAYRRPDRALREAFRVLRPTGLLLTATYCHGETPRQWRRTQQDPMGAVRVRHAFTRASLEAVVRKAGFTPVTAEVLAPDPYLLYLTAQRT